MGLGIEIGNCGKLLFNMRKVEYIQQGTRLNYHHWGFVLNTGLETRIWDWNWELDLQIGIRNCNLGLIFGIRRDSGDAD